MEMITHSEAREDFDRRNAIHNMLNPNAYAHYENAFVLDLPEGEHQVRVSAPFFREWERTQRHPLLLVLEQHAGGEELCLYAWGICRRNALRRTDSLTAPAKKINGTGKREGLYLLSRGVRQWARDVEQGRAKTLVTLVVHEDYRQITLDTEKPPA